ncbi:MAG: hypothetical protein ACJA0B_001518 [Alcanivorax borkumensis]
MTRRLSLILGVKVAPAAGFGLKVITEVEALKIDKLP